MSKVYYTYAHLEVPLEIQRGIWQLRFIWHSWAKEKGELWLGTSKGREAIHLEVEKQMFGKEMFTRSSLTMGQREGLARFKWALLGSPLSHTNFY